MLMYSIQILLRSMSLMFKTGIIKWELNLSMSLQLDFEDYKT